MGSVRFRVSQKIRRRPWPSAAHVRPASVPARTPLVASLTLPRFPVLLRRVWPILAPEKRKFRALLRIVWVEWKRKSSLKGWTGAEEGPARGARGRFGREATHHGALSNSRTLGLIRRVPRSPLARIVLRPSSLSGTQPLRGGFLFLPHQT